MKNKTDRLQKAVLSILSEAIAPMGASAVNDMLVAAGIDVSARTVRLHLLELDKRGLTKLVNRRAGREITAAGRLELQRIDVIAKVGFISARVEALGYEMNYDPSRNPAGAVVVNTTLLHPKCLDPALDIIREVLRARLGIGHAIIVAQRGKQIGGQVIPDGYCGLGTVCSVTLTGIMSKRGIPIVSRYGGLLEYRNHKPIRFVELIEYRGSTLDPLEIFIQAGMTRVRDTIQHGNGLVCASFREMPAVAVPDAMKLVDELRQANLGGVIAIGRQGQPLMGIPVSDGHVGLVVLGGLNSIAAVREAGYAVRIRSLAGLEPMAKFKAMR
jgi:hypothetical protein